MNKSSFAEFFNQRISKKKSVIILLLITFLILNLLYPRAIFSPNKYLFNSSGDGMKNYYTYAYVIKNDTSFINSKCVNYPFGEHFSYLDSQPILSFPLKLLSQIFPSIANYSVGILNFLLIMSILFSVVLIYLILKEFQVGNLYAMLSSILISLLSPQFYRLWGHYGLSYVFFLPLVWYLLIKFFKTNKKKYSIILIISLIIIYFIHAYIGLISTLFIFFSALFYFIFYKNYRTLKNIFHILIQIFIPILLYLAVTVYTDSHINRSDSPAGLYIYVANLNTVFLPYDGALQKIYRLFFNIGEQSLEGISYVGLWVNLILIFFIIYILILIYKRNLSQIKMIIPKEMWIFFISAIILLLISMVFPLKVIVDFVMEYVKPLRQFRALGRLAWVFYYVVNVFAAIIIYGFYKQLKLKNKKYMGMLILVVSQLIFISEVYVYQRDFSEGVLKQNNYLNYTYLPNNYKDALSHIDEKKYQAILPLPFFHYGSEDFMISPPESSQSPLNSMIIAFHKNMALLASNSPRTSVDEAKDIIQILMPEYYQKDIKKHLKSTKPFLVLYTKETLTSYEKRLLSLSDIFYENNDFVLAKLDFDKLFQVSDEEVLKKYMSINDSLHIKNGFLVSDTNKFIYYNDFETNRSPIRHSGYGCFKNAKNNYSTLAEFNADVFNSDTSYEVSFWFYNKGHGCTQNMIALEETDENHKYSWIAATDARFCVIIDGDWSLVQTYFKPKNKHCHYKVFLAPSKNWIDSIYVDDLLIRPVNVDVFKVVNGEKNKGILIYNNQYIQTDIDYTVLCCSCELISSLFINRINNSKDWLESVKIDANKRKIPLNEAIRLNAEYMAYVTLFNIDNNKELKLLYYIHQIKTSKKWLNEIINKPENKNKNIDSLIYGNAMYMVNCHYAKK